MVGGSIPPSRTDMLRFALVLALLFVLLSGMNSFISVEIVETENEAMFEAQRQVSSTSTEGTTELESDNASTTTHADPEVSTTSREQTKTPPVSSSIVSPTKVKTLDTTKQTKLPLSPDELNEKARSALVNIICEGESPLKTMSGSGVVIDPRGIILTNAHVAQYFLLENTDISATCVIRTGSPARAEWHAKLIFIPSEWVEKHAGDLLQTRTIGTGEHDYAFLAITDAIDGPLPASFSYIPLDIEEAAAVPGDDVLLAGYPAEFVGGRAARDSLFASTVFTTIQRLLTFTEKTVDVVSVSGTALAQSGSSGGGFISVTGSLVGIVVTTSIGETTSERSLHAITPSYISRSIKLHTGESITQLFSPPLSTLVSNFAATNFIELSKKLADAISKSQH